MADLLWAKFYWTDWLSDIALRRCSLAARGLWMDMLCIAAQHDPIGYVAVNGQGCSETDLARLCGTSYDDIKSLLAELEANSVFSRDRTGKIYSRRMISDAKKRAEAKKNGMKGGNPSLSNTTTKSTSVNPQSKGEDKTQRLETRDQRSEKCEVVPPNTPLVALQGAQSKSQLSPPQAAFEMWNEMAPKHGLPKATAMTDKRRRQIAARLKECGGLPGWQIALDKIAALPVLHGNNDRGWKISLDALITPDKFARLMEDQYANWKPTRVPSAGRRDALADGFDFNEGLLARREARAVDEDAA